MIRKTKTYGLLILVALFLGACATIYRTDVTRFHEMAGPTGETFIIQAKSPEKDGSLELQSYSNVVSDYLQREGYTPATSGTPDVVVKIDYAVSPPIERTREDDGFGPFYGNHYYFRGRYYAGFPYYAGTPYYGYSYYNPVWYRRAGFGYGFGYFNYNYTYTVYESAFEMTIERAENDVLFEGLVKSVNRENDMTTLVPVLVEAMFTNFPGESGSQEKVTIKQENNTGP